MSAQAQEDLRRRVVGAVEEGLSQAEAARLLGVSRQSVNTWMRRHRQGGAAALRTGSRGRPPRPRLRPEEGRQAVRLITDRCPDQLKPPFALWTRQAVQRLLAERFGVTVSVWTVGRYLTDWGFTPQKPLRRAYEQKPAAARWLKKEYPALRRLARLEGAQIYWADEMGFRSDHQAGRSFSPKGRTPVIAGTGRRFGCNLISAITNRGRLAFMVFRGRFTAKVFLIFLRRLLRQVEGKLFLIVDRHPVHRSRDVKAWLARHADRLRLIFLPSYSPELNPDELLNQDVKSNAVERRRPADQAEMIRDVRAYLQSTQRCPDIVQNHFRPPNVQNAAA
ncbi:MAG: IS630 family transposase [Nitrospinota bacterium]